MSLISLIEPGGDDGPQSRFLATVPPINLFKALAHAPGVASVTAQMGGVLLYRGSLDAGLRELAILRAAHLAGSDYEVGHHERIGRDVGLAPEQIAATRKGADRAALTKPAQLVLRWADEVFDGGRAERASVEEAVQAFGVQGAVELSITIGYYLMVAGFLSTFEVPFEGAAFDQGVDINRAPSAES